MRSSVRPADGIPRGTVEPRSIVYHVADPGPRGGAAGTPQEDTMHRHAHRPIALLAIGATLAVLSACSGSPEAPTAEADGGGPMADRLDGHTSVREIVQYRVGPSVGVHTGPGTAGGFFYPAR